MTTAFITIIQTLIAERGKEALLDAAKAKSLLADYTRGEFPKERRLLLQALDAGVGKAIDSAQDLQICKRQQVRMLTDEHFLAEPMAADVVNMLALVLRGDTSKLEYFSTANTGIDTRYKISINFQQSGPFDMQQLKQMVQNGKISAEYWVCMEGNENWGSIKEIPELKALFAAQKKEKTAERTNAKTRPAQPQKDPPQKTASTPATRLPADSPADLREVSPMSNPVSITEETSKPKAKSSAIFSGVGAKVFVIILVIAVIIGTVTGGIINGIAFGLALIFATMLFGGLFALIGLIITGIKSLFHR